MAAIPHCNIVCDSRKKSSFSDSEKETCNEKTMVGFDDSHKCHNNAPSNHNCRKPDGRTETLEPVFMSVLQSATFETRSCCWDIHQITWYLKSAIGEEEDRQTPVVLRASQLQSLRQPFNFRIADIPSIQKAQQI